MYLDCELLSIFLDINLFISFVIWSFVYLISMIARLWSFMGSHILSEINLK